MSETVVLLHGMARTKLSMAVAAARIRRAGFDVLNLQYPSTRDSIERLAEIVCGKIETAVGDSVSPVHFLTHSLGGIVARALLASREPGFVVGHIVMLAPPSRGSQLAERFGDNAIYRAVTGPPGQQLRANRDGIAESLGAVERHVGVIAGRSNGPLSFLLDGESDGIVSIDETRMPGMADFIVVPRGHTFVMYDRKVVDQAIHFFRHGKFAR